MRTAAHHWSNESVMRLAGERDPVEAVVQAAREMVLEAIDKGWFGPPYDPFRLAEMRGIAVSPRADIPDARTRSPSGKTDCSSSTTPCGPRAACDTPLPTNSHIHCSRIVESGSAIEPKLASDTITGSSRRCAMSRLPRYSCRSAAWNANSVIH